jgi:hypothetical protein
MLRQGARFGTEPQRILAFFSSLFFLDPFRLLLISLAGGLTQNPHDVIDYLQEESRVRRQQLANMRLRLNDDQRCRLALKTNKLG